jgi:hypothetical protein
LKQVALLLTKAESIFLRRAARHASHRRLLRLRRASSCFGTSRGLSRDSSSTTSPRAGSPSTTSPTPRVWVPRHIARLVTRLIVDSFDYAARPGASARRAAHHTTLRTTRHRLLRLHRASGCLGTSRDSLRGLSSTTSTTLRVRVPRHIAWLITHSSRRSSSTTSPTPRVRVPRHVARLVVDYLAASRGSSSGSSRRSSSTTSPTLRVWVPRHVARLVTRLIVDYFTYAARPVASARRAACRVTHRRLLRLAQARR